MRPQERAARLDRLQAGFTLALSMMVTAVVVMLAAGLMLRIVNDVKGAKISSQAAMVSGDAEVALNLAEAEVFQDIDLLHSAIWSSTMSDVITDDANGPGEPDPDFPCPSTANGACVSPDTSNPQFPVRELQLLGNARNWPAFGNWRHYVTSAAYKPVGKTASGYVAEDTLGVNPKVPAVVWNAGDRDLTRGWWRVPRNDAVDNDYYGFNSVSNPGEVFPAAIAGEKTTRTANTSYSGDASVTAVTHNYFYEELLPIRGEKISANRIPVGSIWPNAEDEYGTGAGATASGTIAAVTRYVWDTPFYKKVYKLQNNRKVAVYCRLDLRDYFNADAAAPAKDKWTPPGPPNSKDNFLKFFLAAIPEGRLEQVPGENKKQYYGGELKTKYILIKTGGMRNLDLAGVTIAGQTDDRQYPAVIQTSGGVLRGAPDATSGFGQDIRGLLFRADGNRGFNWSTLGTRSTQVKFGPAPGINPWTPVASERYVYLFEKIGSNDPAYLIYASYPHTAVNQDNRAPTNLDKSKWVFKRRRIDDIVLIDGSFDEPDAVNNIDATVSMQSSFSAVADPDGTWVVSAASGDPSDCNNFVGGDCLDSKMDQPATRKVELFWRGPVAGRTYYTAQFPAKYNRQGLPFQATPSAGTMR